MGIEAAALRWRSVMFELGLLAALACLPQAAQAQSPLTPGDTIRVRWSSGLDDWSGLGEMRETRATGIYRGVVRDTLLLSHEDRLLRFPLQELLSVHRPAGQAQTPAWKLILVGAAAGFAAGYGVGALVEYAAPDKTWPDATSVADGAMTVGTQVGIPLGIILGFTVGKNRRVYDAINIEGLMRGLSVTPTGGVGIGVSVQPPWSR